MASGILHNLGVEMHPKDNPNPQAPRGSFEDPLWLSITSRMNQAAEKGQGRAHVGRKFRAEIVKAVKKRERPLWGFKSALAHHWLEHLLPHLKNPHFVVVWRNPLPHALSYQVHAKHNYGRNLDLAQALTIIGRSLRYLIEAMETYKHIPNTHFVCEDMRTKPLEVASIMATHFGLQLDVHKTKAIQEFILADYSTLKG
jgi:hypothetical protein